MGFRESSGICEDLRIAQTGYRVVLFADEDIIRLLEYDHKSDSWYLTGHLSDFHDEPTHWIIYKGRIYCDVAIFSYGAVNKQSCCHSWLESNQPCQDCSLPIVYETLQNRDGRLDIEMMQATITVVSDQLAHGD